MSKTNRAAVPSSQTAESILRREAQSGMWTMDADLGLDVFVFNMDGSIRVDDGNKARHEARSFATPADVFAAFPALLTYCKREAAIPTWQDHLRAAIVVASKKCGCDISGLKWDTATLDNTWGDLVGLVFYGASDDANKRAAEFFAAWMDKHGRAMNIVGGYERQSSIGVRGVRHFARYDNGAEGWYSDPAKQNIYEGAPVLVQTRIGYSASYVYYPGAE